MAIDRFFAQALVKAREQQAAIDAEKKAKQTQIELQTRNGSKPQSSSNNPGATVDASVTPNPSVRPK